MIRRKSFLKWSRVKFLVLLLISTATISVSEHLLNNYLQPQQIFSPTFSSSVVLAQSLRPEFVASKVYEAIPNFPKENNYINQETKQVDADNTLITRLVRYHQYIKTRPTIFRLDWKLTLADYLGKNEIIKEDRYPGYSSLTENPLPEDRKAIANLTVKQRNELVDLLVSIYNPNSQNNSTNSGQQNKPPAGNENSSSFQLPQTGAADLLLP
jgi:hypothetical protein